MIWYVIWLDKFEVFLAVTQKIRMKNYKKLFKIMIIRDKKEVFLLEIKNNNMYMKIKN